jgi:hypothetical protein
MARKPLMCRYIHIETVEVGSGLGRRQDASGCRKGESGNKDAPADCAQRFRRNETREAGKIGEGEQPPKSGTTVKCPAPASLYTEVLHFNAKNARGSRFFSHRN